MNPITLQWIIVITFGLGLLWLSPRARTVDQFFKAATQNRQPGMLLLTSSLVISWIFAKSITNAANLGMSYGLLGGLAYAGYYLSFLVCGLVLFNLRVKGKFQSIHQFLEQKFGRKALVLFSVLIAIRLFNEVWSNTMVIGSYFGESGSWPYYGAVLAFTGLTLAYAIKGGLRSSLFTDAIQMVLFGVILFVILAMLLPDIAGGVGYVTQSSSWDSEGGINLVWVVLIQVFSYPFHDPVMTDRAFITDPHTTRKSFIWATVIGFICILLFSLVGVYAQNQGLQGDQAPVLVNRTLGVGMMLLMNTIMITSASSTLDSTFASFSKLAVVDWKNKITIANGRLAMVVLTVLGTIPVFLGPTILSATTISGTMVIGLAPVFLFWKRKAPPLSFLLAVSCGLLFGVLLAGGWYPKGLVFFSGPYADLLSANIVGTILSLLLYFIPVIAMRNK
ncbi:MAG TPA: sodium:solute symporter [Cryomorphaceae bacterium]|nr:sodium:solute symporter [Owenweeksia sp.]MBF98902.1 sodium:solute symporter [Owenweeksia sp.]HAD98402.1 sodium:solute symporter [Cryomorphaceae bacterium]